MRKYLPNKLRFRILVVVQDVRELWAERNGALWRQQLPGYRLIQHHMWSCIIRPARHVLTRNRVRGKWEVFNSSTSTRMDGPILATTLLLEAMEMFSRVVDGPRPGHMHQTSMTNRLAWYSLGILWMARRRRQRQMHFMRLSNVAFRRNMWRRRTNWLAIDRCGVRNALAQNYTTWWSSGHITLRKCDNHISPINSWSTTKTK